MRGATFALQLLLLASAIASGHPETKQQAGIPQDTRRYCIDASDYANENPDSFLYFSAVAQNPDPGLDKWHRLPSSEAFKNASSEKDSTAEVSMREGKPVIVFFTFQNQFGDSEEFAQYCYRGDGTLAFIHSYLKSYHANRGLVRDAWFEASGKKVFTDQHVQDLQTLKTAKLPPDFWDMPPPEFLRVSELPFAGEISSVPTSR